VLLAGCVILLLAAYDLRLLLIAGIGVAIGVIAQNLRARVWRRRRQSRQMVEASNAWGGHAIGDTRIPEPPLVSRSKNSRLSADSKIAALAFAMGAGIVIGVFLSYTSGGSQAVGQGIPAVVAVPRYEGTATYQGGGWDVTDRIVFDSDSLNPVRRLAGPPGRPLSESDTVAVLVDRLGRQGWSASQIGADTVFTRPRQVRATVRLFPLSTLRRLPVVPPSAIALPNGRLLSFAAGERSQLTLTTGAHVVGITAPAGLRTATASGETFQINLGAPFAGQVDVQMQLLSPLMRNELGAMLGRLSAGEVMKWLMLLIAAICAEEIKQFLRDVLHRLRSRLPLPLDRPAASPAESIDGTHRHHVVTEGAMATAQTPPDPGALNADQQLADLAADQPPSERERPDDH